MWRIPPNPCFIFFNRNNVIILIGYYTVDCTIPEYIWTSAQITTILDEPIDSDLKNYDYVIDSDLQKYM